jgi:DNA polymerase-3 subunit alpha
MSDIHATAFLRVYSDMGSPKRSVLTLDKIIEKAEAAGAEAVALTDVTMYGIQDMLDRLQHKKSKVKLIIGATVYMVETVTMASSVPLTCVLYAKDIIGYHAVCRITTEAQKHVLTINGMDYPCIDKDILSSYIGENTEGHGHVIVLSGGADGILSGIAEANNMNQAELQHITNDLKSFDSIRLNVSNLQNDIATLTQKKADLQALSKLKFDTEERELKAQDNPDPDRCAMLWKKKEAVKQAAVDAKATSNMLSSRNKELRQMKELLSKTTGIIDPCEEDFIKYQQSLKDRQNKLNAVLSEKQDIPGLTLKEMQWYQKTAGQGCFYVELQAHNCPKEKATMYDLAEIAVKNNIPVVATNTSLMAESSDLDIRQAIRSMAQNIWVNANPGEENMFLRDDEDLKHALSGEIGASYTEEAFRNISTVVNACNVEFPTETHYPAYPCTEYTDDTAHKFELCCERFTFKKSKDALSKADKLLAVKTLDGLKWRYKDDVLTNPEKENQIFSRAEHELNVIFEMGFSDYFLIVQDFLDIGRRCGYMPAERLKYLSLHYQDMSISEMNDYINADQTYPGLTIGPGRGSAAGSIVTYAIGITSIDPLKHELLFERFLNPKRVTMPDIDSDFSKSEFEYGVRNIVIGYVSKKYGQDGVCGIATPSTLAAKAAVKTMVRIYGAKNAKDTMAYDALGRGMVAKIPNDPHTMLSDVEAEIISKYGDNKDAMNILNMAKRVEGLNVNFGRHACGNIIVGNRDVGAYAPLMLEQDSGQWKIEMNAELAESNKFLKMDFLGLKNLNVITKTLRAIYHDTGTFIDPLKIPEDPAIYQKIFSMGYTNSIFQFESAGMKKMLQKFKPERFSDLVLLVACYRPGPLQYLDGIIKRKNHQQTEETAVTRIADYHPEFRKIVEPTYSALVYQEQIMQTFRTLAGYDMGGADNVRRAMGHKKMDILVAEKKNFVYGNPDLDIKGAVQNGVKEQDALDLFEEMIEFAKYSFNKSHAAAYAMIAYITAWLKYYYPTAFYASALSFVAFDKYPGLIYEAKQFGVNVLVPDVNKSSVDFTESDNNIYFGFGGIKGIGQAAAEKIRPEGKTFTDIYDFYLNTGAGKSDIVKLIQVGALDSLWPNRAALLTIHEDFSKWIDQIQKKKSMLNKAKEMMKDLEETGQISREKYNIKSKTMPTRARIERKIEQTELEYRGLLNDFSNAPIPKNVMEDPKGKLMDEQKLLGNPISGSFLDAYTVPDGWKKYALTNIIDLTEDMKTVYVMGTINDLKFTKKKATGEDLAFFNLTDKTRRLKVCVFSKAYAAAAPSLAEGAVVVIRGAVLKDNEDNDNLSLSVYQMAPAEEKRSQYQILLTGDLKEFAEKYTEIKSYAAENGKGHQAAIAMGLTGKIINLPFTVTDGIKNMGLTLYEI